MQDFLKRLTGKDVVAVVSNVAALVYGIASENVSIVVGRLFGKPPTLVYQPGRVGSISVVRSLRRAWQYSFVHSPVYHTHYLFQIQEVEDYVRANRPNPAETLHDLEKSRRIRGELDADPKRRWNIVSLVRDPVALRVSALFHNLGEHVPDWVSLSRTNKLSMEYLQNLLISKEEFSPQHLDAWFEVEFKGMFGLDVYSVPFDTQEGYSIYPINGRFRLLIIRLEDLDRVGAEAFREFLGARRFYVLRENTAEDEPYRDLYRQFTSLPLPRQYVEGAYSTRWARHFYTEREIEAFTARWTAAS